MNRIANLRQATRSQNMANARQKANNTSGFKGVHFLRGKWQAQIQIGGRRIHLGCYLTPEVAHMAYRIAAKKHFGEFARTE